MHASHADWLQMIAEKLDCYWQGADTGAVKALDISMSQNLVRCCLCVLFSTRAGCSCRGASFSSASLQVYRPNLPGDDTSENGLARKPSAGSLISAEPTSPSPAKEPEPEPAKAPAPVPKAEPAKQPAPKADAPAPEADVPKAEAPASETGKVRPKRPGPNILSAHSPSRTRAHFFPTPQTMTHEEILQEYRAVIAKIKERHPEDPYAIATLQCGYWGSEPCEAGGIEIADLAFKAKKKTSNIKHTETVELSITAVEIKAVAGDGNVRFDVARSFELTLP